MHEYQSGDGTPRSQLQERVHGVSGEAAAHKRFDSDGFPILRLDAAV